MRRIKWSIPLLVALILAGCGSSGTSTVDGRAKYIAEADALCRSSNAREEALHRQAAGLPVTNLPPILRQQAKVAAALWIQLGRLRPPTEDSVVVRRFVQAVHQLSIYTQAVANSIDAGHAYATRALATKLSLAREQEILLGQGYGYRTCASGRSYTY